MELSGLAVLQRDTKGPLMPPPSLQRQLSRPSPLIHYYYNDSFTYLSTLSESHLDHSVPPGTIHMDSNYNLFAPRTSRKCSDGGLCHNTVPPQPRIPHYQGFPFNHLRFVDLEACWLTWYNNRHPRIIAPQTLSTESATHRQTRKCVKPENVWWEIDSFRIAGLTKATRSSLNTDVLKEEGHLSIFFFLVRWEVT